MANCTAERVFSVLNPVKNIRRSLLGDKKFNCLILMCYVWRTHNFEHWIFRDHRNIRSRESTEKAFVQNVHTWQKSNSFISVIHILVYLNNDWIILFFVLFTSFLILYFAIFSLTSFEIIINNSYIKYSFNFYCHSISFIMEGAEIYGAQVPWALNSRLATDTLVPP